MNVGILGSGEVAKTLAAGFIRHGHEVLLGTRDPSKLEQWATGHDIENHRVKRLVLL